jgi:hypothetical protein
MFVTNKCPFILWGDKKSGGLNILISRPQMGDRLIFLNRCKVLSPAAPNALSLPGKGESIVIFHTL